MAGKGTASVSTEFNGLHLANMFLAGMSFGLAFFAAIEGVLWLAIFNALAALVNVGAFALAYPKVRQQ